VLFTQYYVECLSQASYLIADTGTGQAVVVDPRRDVSEYLADAAAHGLTITGMINTHFHADFVSGHLELADATGAWIGYGTAAQADFPVRHLADGERISLGDVKLQILATPGHTPESISVLVFEHAADEVAYGVLTGDALFIGDAGRPDLLASIGFAAEQLGAQLYHSIQTVLMGLPDAVRVFPAHGAGSACGKNLSTERQSTIGEQRRLNYACQPMSQEQFVALVTADQPSAPPYFVYNAILNRHERDHRQLTVTVPLLDDPAIEAELAASAVVLDTRPPVEYAAGHLAGSVNVGADGRMAETVGMVLEPTQRIVLLSPVGEADEDAMRLARIGFDRVVGAVTQPEAYLERHAADVVRASRLTAVQLAEALRSTPGITLVDLRNPGERATGMLPGAVPIPLAELARRTGEDRPAPPGRRLLRRRLAVQRRGEPAPQPGRRGRVRPDRRLRRVDSAARDPARLTGSSVTSLQAPPCRQESGMARVVVLGAGISGHTRCTAPAAPARQAARRRRRVAELEVELDPLQHLGRCREDDHRAGHLPAGPDLPAQGDRVPPGAGRRPAPGGQPGPAGAARRPSSAPIPSTPVSPTR